MVDAALRAANFGARVRDSPSARDSMGRPSIGVKVKLSRVLWIALPLALAAVVAIVVITSDSSEPEQTSEEATSDDPTSGDATHEEPEDDTPPPDPYAGADLPITASQVPLPEQDLPVVRATLSELSVAGEVLGPLEEGAIRNMQDSDAYTEELGVRLMGAVAEEDAQVLIAPDRGVQHHVVSMILQTAHDVGARPLLVAVDSAGEKRLVPFHIPTEDELDSLASFRMRTERPRSQDSSQHQAQQVARHPMMEIEAGFGLPTLGLGIGRSPMAGNIVQLTAHSVGIWLVGGTLRAPLAHLRGLGPRSARHPNLRATMAWSAGTDVAQWLDWAEVQAQLFQVRADAERRAITIQPRVGLDGSLPYELLVRVLDVVQFGVSPQALQNGDFESLFLSGEERTDLFAPPAIMLTL